MDISWNILVLQRSASLNVLRITGTENMSLVPEFSLDISQDQFNSLTSVLIRVKVDE